MRISRYRDAQFDEQNKERKGLIMKRALTVGLVVTLLLVFALPAMADEVDTEGDVVVPPGSGLHFAQQIVEMTQEGLLRDPDRRAEFTAKMLERRMNEMRVVAAGGQTEHVGYLTRQTERIMSRIEDALGRAKGRPEFDVTDGAIAVLEATDTAEETLQGLIDSGDMPDEALEGLNRALAAVRGGGVSAREILQDIFGEDFPGDADRAGGPLDRPGGPGNGGGE